MKKREISNLKDISEQELEEGEIKDEYDYDGGESTMDKESATNMIDLFNSQFMVLDSIESVGSSDVEEISDSEDEQKNEMIGEEFCKLVYYCELCLKRLSSKEKDRAFRLHCISKPHRKKYEQFQKAKTDKIDNNKRSRYTKYFIEKDHDNENK